MLKRKSHRKAILRCLSKHERVKKAFLITYLGAQDAWNAVDYDLRLMRQEGLIRYSFGYWRPV